MYKDSIRARREIARNFTALNYRVDPCTGRRSAWALIATFRPKMRPNVPVPSRRKVIPFLKMMHQETGSMLKAILAFGFDGPRHPAAVHFALREKLGSTSPTMRKTFTTKTGKSPSRNWCRPGGFSR